MNRSSIEARVGILFLGIALAAGVCVRRAAAGEAQPEKGERQVTLKDLPSAVRAAAEKAVAGGVLERIVVEQEDGQDAYAVEARFGGKTKEFTFASDATLLAEEEDVAVAELPEAVRVAAGRYFGGGSGLRASMEIVNGVTTFEVEGRKNGENVSVTFSAAGAQLEEEEDGD